MRKPLFTQLGAKSAGFLLLDRPGGLTGHNAGGSLAFNDRFGPCLLRFVTATGNSPASC